MSTAPNFAFPLCFSTFSCGSYDPASPYIGATGYPQELLTGCCPAPGFCDPAVCPFCGGAQLQSGADICLAAP
jgi:hypothetical protein